MREILFRGKRTDNGDWVYGCYVKIHDYEGNVTHHISPPWCKVAPETVGQYTGLTDKNGKKIFEGDICKDSVGNIFVVTWDKGNARFLGRCQDGKMMYVGKEPKIEIIGNIRDDPELLKEV